MNLVYKMHKMQMNESNILINTNKSMNLINE